MANEYYPQGQHTRQMTQQIPQQQGYQQQAYQQGYQQQAYQQGYQQPPAMQRSFMPQLRDEVTSTGEWVLTLFLLCIPLVNIILLFVWAFGSNTAASKKNWARANLIWTLIGILFCIALFAIAMAMGISYEEIIQYSQH